MAESPIISVDHLPTAVIVRVLTGDLRKTEIEALCAAVDAARVVAPSLPFVLDMGRVTFAGSMALGTLVGLSKEFGTRKQPFIIVDVQKDVRESIEISRVNRVMDIMPDVPSALGRLAGAADAPPADGPQGGSQK